MKIGIGLPSTFRNISGSLIRDWARLADAGPFSSLAVLDRLVYQDHESLMTLAVAAGETRRIRLMTAILLAPLRNTGMLAKQAMSLDALSEGRLTLGFGLGGRQDDYQAASVSFQSRGKRLEQQLAQLTGLWSGQRGDEQLAVPGPAPVQQGGPEILIGAFMPTAIGRLERWGHGYLAGGGDLQQINECFRLAEKFWQRGGRAGKPRLVADAYYGLGPRGAERSTEYILDYHAPLGPMAHQMARFVLSTPEAVRACIQGFEALGTDELVLMPCIPELDQVERLRDCLV
ncbi:MAG TPA: LLM class flavin-dependent oxidoreductase [Ktedonobacteraceae bacterium]|jgi:alkanesulfonate monooxygenase SsuD/methylene tetrahydromethanopterin reductase-like flavin-dependent oxidoreductase (luciferase family)